jgi:hypothetical protein
MEIGTRIDPFSSELLTAWQFALLPGWAVLSGSFPIEGASS